MHCLLIPHGVEPYPSHTPAPAAIFAQLDASVTDPVNKVRTGISNMMAYSLLITL
jgi:hypothetical protein